MDTTGTFWLPPDNSTIASDVDALFNFILYASVFFFIVVVAGMVYFGIKYRRRDKDELTTSISHHFGLEVLWIVVPTILIFIVFVWGFETYLKMQVPPAESLEINATGQKWFWSFEYPEGASSTNDLVVPVNRPVKLLLSSQDVLHSFFVPNFRVKMDVLPNRYTTVWFEPTQIGEYDLFCTEFCGQGHSEMIGKVRVMTQEDYERWIEESSNLGEGLTLEEYGEQLYTQKACNTCHSIDGSRIQGPSFLNAYGKEERMTSGETIVVDENYLRESILNPQAKIVAGYQPVMPTFQGILRPRQVDALIAYIKSLSDAANESQASATDTTQTEAESQ